MSSLVRSRPFAASTSTSTSSSLPTSTSADPIKQLHDTQQLSHTHHSYTLSPHTRISYTSFITWLSTIEMTSHGVTAAMIQALLICSYEGEMMKKEKEEQKEIISTTTTTIPTIGQQCLAAVLDTSLVQSNGDNPPTLTPYDRIFLQQSLYFPSSSHLLTRYCHSPDPVDGHNSLTTWQLQVEENFFSTDASSFDSRVVSRFLSSDGFQQHLIPVRLRQNQAGSWRVYGWHCVLGRD